jgi:hypothetical protein
MSNFLTPANDGMVSPGAVFGRGATAMPTPATSDGQVIGAMVDNIGRSVQTGSNIRTLCVTSTATVTTSAAVVLMPAASTATFNDLSGLFITTQSAAIATIAISDGNNTLLILDYPNAASAPTAPIVIDFTPPLSQSVAATAWMITCSTVGGKSYHVTAQFVQGK